MPSWASAAQAIAGSAKANWLDPGVAADLVFETAEEIGPLRERLAAFAADAQADVIVQPAATRAKSLLVADMDSTLIGQECIDELAAAIGIGPRVAAITERAMRGEIEFEGALRERVGLLADSPLSP